MLFTLFTLASGLMGLPVSARTLDIWAHPPCRERIDPPGAMPGTEFRTGIYDCMYLLADKANANETVRVIFEFKLSGLAPAASNLEQAVTPALTLIGPVTSYREPRFEGSAQFILMPIWKDTAAQDASLLGYDWSPAPGSAKGVKCATTQKTTLCRAIVRNSNKLFIHATFAPGNEPVDETYAALAAFVADF